MSAFRIAALGAVVMLAALDVQAQGGGGRGRSGPGGGPNQRPAQRAQIEAQLRQELAGQFRVLAQLTDSQYTRLLGVNQQLAQRTRQVMDRENRARMSLRRQLALGAGANQDSVTMLIQQVISSRREFLNIVESEQSMLAAFLTPVQRAQYLVLQENIHRRIDDMVYGRAAGQAGVGRGLGRGPDGRGGQRGGPPPPGTPPPRVR